MLKCFLKQTKAPKHSTNNFVVLTLSGEVRHCLYYLQYIPIVNVVFLALCTATTRLNSVRIHTGPMFEQILHYTLFTILT